MPYVSGEECYTKFNKPEFLVSGWQFLEVPIDYTIGATGKTKISYKLSPGFSLEKKTIIYFNGGPGGTSVHADFNALTDINVIYMNQRGAAFSRPQTRELFYNKDYYSSENTARDALEIVKHLGLIQVTAYGMSYGTVPATIFGSLFPKYTRNVILEGVVYDGASRLWSGSHRIKLLQKYFDKLDKPLQEKILKYSRHPEVFPGWFSSLGQPRMYSEYYEKSVTEALNEIFQSNEELSETEKEQFILTKLKSYDYLKLEELPESVWFSPTMLSFIGCKELSAQEPTSNFYSVFNELGKLIPYERTQTHKDYCQKHGIAKAKTYSAANYPLTVPVYYFQGTTDGATTADYAIWHYKNSAKGRAEIVLAKQKGHSVVIEQLTQLEEHDLMDQALQKKNSPAAEEAKRKRAQRQEILTVFISAINNETLNLSKLNDLIGDKKSAWVKTSK